MHHAAKHLKSMVRLSISAGFVKRFRSQRALPASGERFHPLRSVLHLTTNELETRRNPGRAKGGSSSQCSDTSDVGAEADIARDIVNVSILANHDRFNDGATLRCRASKYDCEACRLKPRCCPKEPARYLPRLIYEGARDMARQIANWWQGRTRDNCARKLNAVRPSQTHSQTRSAQTKRTKWRPAMRSFSQQPPKTSESWPS
jgi:hypothetical protein